MACAEHAMTSFRAPHAVQERERSEQLQTQRTDVNGDRVETWCRESWLFISLNNDMKEIAFFIRGVATSVRVTTCEKISLFCHFCFSEPFSIFQFSFLLIFRAYYFLYIFSVHFLFVFSPSPCLYLPFSYLVELLIVFGLPRSYSILFCLFVLICFVRLWCIR